MLARPSERTEPDLYWWEGLDHGGRDWLGYVAWMKATFRGWMTPEERHARTADPTAWRKERREKERRAAVEFLDWQQREREATR